MQKGSKHVRHIVDDLLKRWEGSNVKKGNAVRQAFALAIDEEAKKRVRPVSFKKGTIVVLVESAPWLYKLTLDKQNILEKFNKYYTGRQKAKDIRYRIGKIEED